MAKKLLSLLLALTLCLSVLPMAVQAASKTGDSNGDGSVTVMDATLIQYYVAELISETEVDLKAADTDKDGAITVLDAAEKCGFTNSGHFISEFRKRTGMTPNAYRISKQQNHPEESS